MSEKKSEREEVESEPFREDEDAQTGPQKIDRRNQRQAPTQGESDPAVPKFFK